MSTGRPTIREVARLAEVSHQTVSRVLNRPDTVRPSTRLRVEAAIAALGYIRDEVASSLGRRRSRRPQSAASAPRARDDGS